MAAKKKVSVRRAKPKLPRAPLPKQTGGAHEDKSKRLFRKEKHKKQWTES